MEIKVQSIKFDADQKLMDFIEKKVGKLTRFDDTVTSIDVALSLLEKPDNKHVKIQASVKGGTLVLERNCRTFEEAINECVDAMKEKIIRNKEKRAE